MRPNGKHPKPNPVAEWTVMVYMAGDNNLSAECVWALTEMKKAVGSDNINVIAQFDPSGDYLKTKRFEITKGGVRVYKGLAHRDKSLGGDVSDVASFNPNTGEVHFKNESRKADILADKRHDEKETKEQLAKWLRSKGQYVNVDFAEDSESASPNDTDMASPITLYNFLSFGVQYYPARHYLVVLSGHSAGIQPNYLLRDDSSGRYMTFIQLQAAFQQLKQDLEGHEDGRGKVIDILGFDTCLMSMAEICYQLRGLVHTVIGSETYTPASGWPYFSIVERLGQGVVLSNRKPQEQAISSRQVAKTIVESYIKYYSDYTMGGVSVALSALDVTRVEHLIPAVRKLAGILIRELQKENPAATDRRRNTVRPFTDALILAHWEAQSYNGELYVDLADFCECLSKRYRKAGVASACREVIRCVDDFVIKSGVSGPAYQYSNGCAIYFPWADVGRYFYNFNFAEPSGWACFLEQYTNLTRRGYRLPANPTRKQRRQIELIENAGGNQFLINTRMGSDKMGSDKMGSDKMGSDKMGSDKMGSDKMGSDKMGSDKMGSDKSGNPIHSMRNPPIVSIDLN